MPAVMVTSLTTEKVENVRIVLLTTVKVGIVRIARDLIPTMKVENARSVLMVTALMRRDRPQRPSYNREGARWRPSVSPLFNSNTEGGERPQTSLTTAKVESVLMIGP